MRIAWVVLAAAAGASAASAADRRDGRIETVVHRKTEMVRVPAGAFTMGFPEEPPVVDPETVPPALSECLLAVGRSAQIWCSERGVLFANALPALVDPLHIHPLMPTLNAVPEREVFLPTFEIDRHEVTIAAYRTCVATGACDSGPLLQGDQRHHAEPASPLTNVTWREATEYCAFVGKRLPTEAEWEKTARGTDGRTWPWGEQPRADGSNHGTMAPDAIRMTHSMERGQISNEIDALFELAPDPADGAEYTVPPGTMRWSESRYGAMDMAGNVAEWVADYYGMSGYGDLPADSPVRRVPLNADTRRVVRGGSWLDLALAGRTFARSAAKPGSRSPLIGFRCARDAVVTSGR